MNNSEAWHRDISCEGLTSEDATLFEAAWHTARKHLGWDFTFYLPGMVKLGRERGRYPAISITGETCALLCEHCKGRLLEPMIKVTSPGELIEKGARLKASGSIGTLLSGGADTEGRLPWANYLAAITLLKRNTGLFLSAHVGFPDAKTCVDLKEAGVEQALIDVMGDEETATRIYHLKGIDRVTDSLDAISGSGLPLVPHVVAGLYYGKMREEERVLEILRTSRPSALVIVTLTPQKKTPMAHVAPPSPLEVARLLAKARLLFPQLPISLGCERPRNRQGLLMERLCILAGADRMALWSEESISHAMRLGLTPRFQPTCCSLDFREEWGMLRRDPPGL